MGGGGRGRQRGSWNICGHWWSNMLKVNPSAGIVLRNYRPNLTPTKTVTPTTKTKNTDTCTCMFIVRSKESLGDFGLHIWSSSLEISIFFVLSYSAKVSSFYLDWSPKIISKSNTVQVYMYMNGFDSDNNVV